MRGFLVVVMVVVAGAAGAQNALPCTAGCPARYYFEAQPCRGGTCARSWAPTPNEFMGLNPKGMNLSTPYEGASIELCAPMGQTLSGTGTLRVWTWYPWNKGDVSPSKQLELNVADVFLAGACGYTTQSDGGVVSGVGAGDGGSNVTNDCRCVHWTDWKMGGFSTRRVVIEAVNVAVQPASGGGVPPDGDLEVRLVGLEVFR